MNFRRALPLWLTTTVLAASGMGASLQFTLAIALTPSMPDILHVSPNDASWVITVTLLTSAVVTPILSRMADMYGKRRMLVVSLVALTAGSCIVAIGDSYATTIVGRGLQGFAPSLIPIGISLLRDLLPKERVGSAVALMSATTGIGIALGLPLSGFLYESFGWHAVFWFAAAAGVLFMIAILVCVRESPVRAPARFDWGGALLFSVILTAVLLVISKAGRWDVQAILGLLGVAAIGLGAWIPLQLRISSPMVDLRTMSRRPVLLTNISSLFVTAGTFANMLITTQQVQAPVVSGYGFGLSVVSSGLVMLPAGLVMVVISPLSGRLLNLWGGRTVLMVGNLIMAAAYVFRVFVADSILAVVIGATLIGIGTAFAFASMPTLIMSSVPLTETASANGINSLARALAMSITSALVALLVTTMSITVDGHEFLSPDALHVCFWAAAASTALGALVAAFITVDTRTPLSAAARDHDPAEAVVTGRVALANGAELRRSALVTFMKPDGTQVDWSRTDLDGRYSAVLPGPGRYLMVVNTAGWAPQTRVVEVAGTTSELDLCMTEQLSLTGTITEGPLTVSGAVVVLSRADGEFIASTQCAEDGGYRFPLPIVGPYILTAITPDGEWARARKLIIGVESHECDISVRDSAG